ncbi:MAG: hypothetical protein ACHQ2Y_08865 [Candidatus Lutacidiplasmatales archaeon]
MVTRSWHRVTVCGRFHRSRVLNLPTAWCDGVGLEKGAQLELLAGRVLVVIPPDAHQDAEAIRKLMLQRGFL